MAVAVADTTKAEEATAKAAAAAAHLEGGNPTAGLPDRPVSDENVC